MNLSKKLFGFSKKLAKSAVKDMKKSAVSAFPSHSSKNNNFDLESAYDEFESKYYKTCEKMEHKVYSVSTDNIDPDKNVAGFHKMFSLAHELEDFCNSHGSGGAEFFKINYSDIYKTIQEDLDSYMSDRYEEEKEYFIEYQKRKKAIKSISGKIIKAIQDGGGSILQTELKKTFSGDELIYYDSAIKELIESGKIEKIKPAGRVIFQIK